MSTLVAVAIAIAGSACGLGPHGTLSTTTLPSAQPTSTEPPPREVKIAIGDARSLVVLDAGEQVRLVIDAGKNPTATWTVKNTPDVVSAVDSGTDAQSGTAWFVFQGAKVGGGSIDLALEPKNGAPTRNLVVDVNVNPGPSPN